MHEQNCPPNCNSFSLNALVPSQICEGCSVIYPASCVIDPNDITSCAGYENLNLQEIIFLILSTVYPDCASCLKISNTTAEPVSLKYTDRLGHPIETTLAAGETVIACVILETLVTTATVKTLNSCDLGCPPCVCKTYEVTNLSGQTYRKTYRTCHDEGNIQKEFAIDDNQRMIVCACEDILPVQPIENLSFVEIATCEEPQNCECKIYQIFNHSGTPFTRTYLGCTESGNVTKTVTVDNNQTIVVCACDSIEFINPVEGIDIITSNDICLGDYCTCHIYNVTNLSGSTFTRSYFGCNDGGNYQQSLTIYNGETLVVCACSTIEPLVPIPGITFERTDEICSAPLCDFEVEGEYFTTTTSSTSTSTTSTSSTTTSTTSTTSTTTVARPDCPFDIEITYPTTTTTSTSTTSTSTTTTEAPCECFRVHNASTELGHINYIACGSEAFTEVSLIPGEITFICARQGQWFISGGVVLTSAGACDDACAIPETFCYIVTATGDAIINYVNGYNVEIPLTLLDQQVRLCAWKDSITQIEGSGSITVVGGLVACTDNVACNPLPACDCILFTKDTTNFTNATYSYQDCDGNIIEGTLTNSTGMIKVCGSDPSITNGTYTLLGVCDGGSCVVEPCSCITFDTNGGEAALAYYDCHGDYTVTYTSGSYCGSNPLLLFGNDIAIVTVGDLCKLTDPDTYTCPVPEGCKCVKVTNTDAEKTYYFTYTDCYGVVNTNIPISANSDYIDCMILSSITVSDPMVIFSSTGTCDASIGGFGGGTVFNCTT